MVTYDPDEQKEELDHGTDALELNAQVTAPEEIAHVLYPPPVCKCNFRLVLCSLEMINMSSGGSMKGRVIFIRND